MRKMKKWMSALLVFLFVFQGAAFAEGQTETQKETDELVDSILGDLDYIDDVFQYDLYQFENAPEEGEAGEIIQNERAVHCVLSLGIMSRLPDGRFGENEPVPYNEFAKIILRLAAGEIPSFDRLYDAGETRPVTQAEAAQYLVGALGYQVYENKYPGENPAVSVAAQLKLFQGIEQNLSANITRGEFAQMICRALKMDLLEQVSFGDRPEYRVSKGKTLLSERFHAVEVTGLLNAVPGVNLYSQTRPRKNRIEIDKVTYFTDGTDYSRLLGRRVLGYAVQRDDENEYEISGLVLDERDEAVEISLSALVSADKDELVYVKDGKEEKASVDAVKNVLYNGTAVQDYQFTDELADYEGSIVLGSSKAGGEYDVAVVTVMNTYWVERVTKMDHKIYFKNGLTFGGLPYVDAQSDSERHVTITRDGIPASVEDIQALDVVSIIESTDGSYVSIVASSLKVEGTVDEMSDEGVSLSGEFYPLSRQYLLAVKEAEAGDETAEIHKFRIGDSGVFYLSSDGKIAGYQGESGIEYGFLKQIDKEKGIDGRAMIRLFSENKEWVNLKLAEKLTLDSESVSVDEAFAILNNNSSAVFYQPARYRLNAGQEIVFLDTMIQNPSETNEEEQMMKNYVFEGKLDWTVGFNLQPSSYSVSDKTVIFYLPGESEEELRQEADYDVISQTSFVSQQQVKLSLYNCDSFYKTRVATYVGSVSKQYYGMNVFAVNEVRSIVDRDGAERIKLIGRKSVFIRAGVGSWDPLELIVSEKLAKDGNDFAPGDLFMYVLNAGGELESISPLVRGGIFPQTEKLDNPTADIDNAPGTLEDIDFEGHLIKMSLKDETSEEKRMRIYMPRGVLLWESDRKKFTPIAMEDLNIGDKIYATGNVRHVCLTVFR